MAVSIRRLLPFLPSGDPSRDRPKDLLTGLPSREAVLYELKRSLARARHRHLPTALVIVELSDMSRAGETAVTRHDPFLRHLAHTLRGLVPPEHLVGRLRDREFALLLSGLKMSDVERIADKVVEGMRKVQHADGQGRYVATIVGVGYSTRSDCNASHLLSIADVAIHYARATGRAWHAIADEVRTAQPA